MSDLISRQKAIEALGEVPVGDTGWEIGCRNQWEWDTKILKTLPSVVPEILTIEEVSNQLGCETLQSALYWFEFLKTLDSLNFAIVKKETK